jgi:hypothetical protein
MDPGRLTSAMINRQKRLALNLKRKHKVLGSEKFFWLTGFDEKG